MEQYSLARRTVPELFVWHVIEQLSRAVCYPGLGLTPRNLKNGETRAEAGWTPIVHRDINASSIYLEFPNPSDSDWGELEEIDKQCLPRVILGGFEGVGG
ncbi:hypothetical protein B0H63DRAFT_529653 [Podospora didyma]|uniref:Uncharacterized protein n=1 Tax=Podospora didyma TaxID=330526 RepID=A0AAE0N252_9PEZI|nr:hypothetical protein B0H63DRAFT_529653 [Podospora didyma]